MKNIEWTEEARFSFKIENDEGRDYSEFYYTLAEAKIEDEKLRSDDYDLIWLEEDGIGTVEEVDIHKKQGIKIDRMYDRGMVRVGEDIKGDGQTSRVDIYREERLENGELKYEWVINWSALGNQSVKITEAYMRLMGEAIKIARQLNHEEKLGNLLKD